MVKPMNTTDSKDILLKEDRAADYLALKVSTLRRWRWQGQGPKFFKFGSAVRYSLDELKSYKRESLRHSTSDPGNSKLQNCG